MAENNVNGNGSQDIEIQVDTYEKLPGWKGNLQNMNDILTKVESACMIIFLCILCLTLFTQWVLRFFFTLGYPWMDEIMKYATLWSGFLGASIATTKVAHFRIDLVRMLKSRNAVNRIRAWTYFMAVIFCGVFVYATITYMCTLFKDKEVDFYGLPTWPVFLVVLYFYLVSGARFLLMTIFKLF
ncbi:MAG: TRAP transporter small permease [Spirochaetes bacterium]|jgi:TRAP-type C4-dicarboxylate transport system permease small subunit|nr:TRAP transporter small permease [Spirochaetota bacterium]